VGQQLVAQRVDQRLQRHAARTDPLPEQPRFKRRAASHTPMPSCTSTFMHVVRRLAKILVRHFGFGFSSSNIAARSSFHFVLFMTGYMRDARCICGNVHTMPRGHIARKLPLSTACSCLDIGQAAYPKAAHHQCLQVTEPRLQRRRPG
jgi:hypothetical protein